MAYAKQQRAYRNYSGVGTYPNMAKQTNTTIFWDFNINAYKLSTPYNEGLITSLKQNIPAGERSYDPETKIWIFEEKYFDAVKALCEAIFGCGNVNAKRRSATPPPPPSGGSQYSQQGSTIIRQNNKQEMALSFLQLLPYDLVKSLYRRAMMEMHPDKNPNDSTAHDKVAQLNELWDRIEKEIFGK